MTNRPDRLIIGTMITVGVFIVGYQIYGDSTTDDGTSPIPTKEEIEKQKWTIRLHPLEEFSRFDDPMLVKWTMTLERSERLAMSWDERIKRFKENWVDDYRYLVVVHDWMHGRVIRTTLEFEVPEVPTASYDNAVVTWKFSGFQNSPRKLQMLIDGARYDFISRTFRNAEFELKMDGLKTIVNAKKVEYRLGGSEFQLPAAVQAGMKAFYERCNDMSDNSPGGLTLTKWYNEELEARKQTELKRP